MRKSRGDVVQAMPLYEGKVNVGTGTYDIENVIHCEEDAELTLHFSNGGDVTYIMVAGDDRGYTGKLTVVSGVITHA